MLLTDERLLDALHDIRYISEFLFEDGVSLEHIPPDKLRDTLRIASVIYLALIHEELHKKEK
jgi:hypothetical protein